jgi:glycosyltransferase involved in cell wall biosynthesis
LSIGSGASSQSAASDHSGIGLAFVGVVVPDEPLYRTSAFNRAGNNFQYQLIVGLFNNGIADIEVFSARPIAPFPRSSTRWISPRRERFKSIAVRLLPFPNLTPLKQIVIGLEVLGCLVGWGWRKRGLRSRVVLTYNLSVPPGIFTLLGARLAGAKAVVSVNDIYVSGKTVRPSVLRRIDVRLQRWLLPRFDGHLAVSDQIAADFFPGRSYVRVEGGVDDVFLERTRRTDNTPGEAVAPFVMAYAGEVDRTNGIPLLLEALHIAQRDDFKLRIAGSGPLRSSVEDAARQDPRIEYLGVLDPEGVATLYRSADVLLNIRLTKAMDTRYFFPSKLIEYLASGIPTITTNVAHVESEFDGLVYVLHDESPEGLVGLLSQVASTSRLERLAVAQKARAYVERYKTWDAQAAKVADYIRNVVLRDES